jgi:hypothetical protein
VDSVKIDIGEIGWVGLAQGREKWTALMNAVMNLGAP